MSWFLTQIHPKPSDAYCPIGYKKNTSIVPITPTYRSRQEMMLCTLLIGQFIWTMLFPLLTITSNRLIQLAEFGALSYP